MTAAISLLWVLVGIAILIVLNLKYKMHNVLSLLLVGMFVAIMEQIPFKDIKSVVEGGLGSVLGHLALIVVFGAIIGKMMTESGASQRIADTVVKNCGTKMLPFGLMFIGMIFGIAMFYEVAFLISAPLVVSVARKANIPYMKLIVPTVVGATMGHSLFPPQPGPVALLGVFGADIVQVYVWGMIVCIPAVVVAGLTLPKYVKSYNDMPLKGILKPAEEKPESELPSFGISLLVPLVPAILMIGAQVINGFLDKGTNIHGFFTYIGSDLMSMLITTFVAFYVFGIARGKNGSDISKVVRTSIEEVSNVLLVIAAGGILKQVIIVAGIGNHIVALVDGLALSPLVIAWIITAIIRILTGQGAVAAMTASGIVLPIMEAHNLNPALMLLAVACGSNTITLMYDGGFLLFKETFGISIKDTFKTWGLLELIGSLVGLGMVLILNMFIG